MFIFISGGCKNGKSTHAQRLTLKLAGESARFYIATMIPSDGEDTARIQRHIKERDGMGFTTVEAPFAIESIIPRLNAPGSAALVDSVTALLSNEMFKDGVFDPGAPERVKKGLVALAESSPNAVMVSDYIYCDARRYDELTESYRRGLAYIDAALAARADGVIEVVSGIPVWRKGCAI